MAFKGTLERFHTDSEAALQPWRPFESQDFKLKRYVRSAAGSERPDARNVRPPPVLLECSLELVRSVLRNVDHKDALNFFLDRSRSIRQDFTLQSEWIETETDAKRCFEKSMMVFSRFLVVEGYRYRDEDSMKHLDDALIACLSSLNTIDEFSYYEEILFGRTSSSMHRPPLRLMEYAKNGLWSCVFKQLEKAPLLQRYALARRAIPDMQLRAIAALNTALNGKYPIEFITKILRFENEAVAGHVLQKVGFAIELDNGMKCITFKKSQSITVRDVVNEPLWKRPLAPFALKEDQKAMVEAIFAGVI